MKYSGKWYQKALRWTQVKLYILIRRYKPVPNSVNFYADKKRNGVGVKGYYWRPMTYHVKMEIPEQTVYFSKIYSADYFPVTKEGET